MQFNDNGFYVVNVYKPAETILSIIIKLPQVFVINFEHLQLAL